MFGQDVLKTVSGKEYKGKYLKTEGGKVFFIPEGANSPLQVVPVKLIKKLQLKDGYFIIGGGRNRLTLEEYQKFSTKEKAIYDAKSKNLGKWALFGPMSTILFVGCVFPYWGITDDDEWWENPIFIVPSSSASLIIPYFVLNKEEKFTYPKSLTDDDRLYYKKIYSNKLKQRKFIYIVGSTIVTGAVAFSMFMYYFNATFSIDASFGP